MIFASAGFLVFSLIAILLLRVTRGTTALPASVALLNISFIYIFFGGTAAATLAAIVAVGYGLVTLADSHGRKASIPGILCLVLLYLVFKGYTFVPGLSFLEDLPVVVGFSYLIFRLIHLIVDASEKALPERPGPVQFFAYCLFFPSLLSGPIQRFADFTAGWTVERVQTRDVARVVWGYVKVMLIAPAIFAVHERLLVKSTMPIWAGVDLRLLLHMVPPDTLAHTAGFVAIIGAAAVWFIYLYWNFSGYMDIVIGMSRLAGFVLPENFNRPFQTNGFIDFWTRWNMTLTHWFRTYVFGPLFKVLVSRTNIDTRIQAVFSLFVTFLLVGAWHGTTSPFLVCGVLLGLAAAINKTYQDWIGGWLGKKRYRVLTENFVYQCFCFGLTFVFMSIAIVPFWMPTDQYYGFLKTLFGPAALTLPAFVGVAAIAIGVLRQLELTFFSQISAIYCRAENQIGEEIMFGFAAGVAINLILILTFANYSQLPDFVYQRF